MSVAADESAEANRWVNVITLALGAIGFVYLCEGFLRALFGPLPQDLARRWIESAYFVRRIDSMDVYAGLHVPEPDLGPAHAGGYPPWSTVIGLFLAPPVRQAWLQVYFALVNAAALAFTVRQAFRQGLLQGARAPWLFATSCLAVSANAVVLRNGQYGIIVNACLMAMLAAHAAGDTRRGGFWLAMSALKPQTSALFAFLWTSRKGAGALVVAAAVCGAATAAASWWLSASPVRLVSQVFGQAANWDGGDAGPLRLLLTAGVPREVAIPLLAIVFVSASLVLLYRFRHSTPAIHAAIVCVAGRLWTYHRRYDDVMLVFLLLPLCARALASRRALDWLPYLSVGLTLWLPLREADHGPLLIAVKVAVWLAALAWLLSGARAEQRVTRVESAPSALSLG